MKKGTKIAFALTALLTATGIGIGASIAEAGKGKGRHMGPIGMIGGPKVVFWLMDRNENGAVERVEFEALTDQVFAAKDRNGDGVLNVDDLKGKDGERKMKRGKRMLRWMDKDGDGAISKAEFVAKPARFFDAADSDDDGNVSWEEADSFSKDLRAMHGKKGWKKYDRQGDHEEDGAGQK